VLPKNGLDSALSAHTCSLSENSAAFCLLTMTGACQLAGFATVAAVRPVEAGPSIRDTAMASNPLKPSRPGKLEVRLA
jgi:hypothetical protein